MPFRSEEILERFWAGHANQRLGHAYLLTGSTEAEVEGLGLQLAELMLAAPPEQHPDFYRIRPESKSRRITIEQMRDLEKSLYLKPFKAPAKVALISSAERMCLGQAEAANAFLKTLEEPPTATLLLLCSTRPQLLLPTIISRCLRLDLLPDTRPNAAASMTSSLLDDVGGLVAEWFDHATGSAIRAYARAAALSGYWQKLRAKLEEREIPAEMEGAGEDALKALVEGEFQLARQETLATLQREYWKQAMVAGAAKIPQKTLRAIIALEDLQQSLQQNIDQNLAVERACLAVEGQF